MNPNDEVIFLDAGVFIGGLMRSDVRFAEANPLLQAAQQGEFAACTNVGILRNCKSIISRILSCLDL